MRSFLEVNENNLESSQLINNWLKQCQLEQKPSVIIYHHDQLAHISASISHLMQEKGASVPIDLKEIDKSFFLLGIKYFQSSLHFWNYNNNMFTFDDVPNDKAQAAAVEIFQILVRSIKAG
jgi:hypothetical protein